MRRLFARAIGATIIFVCIGVALLVSWQGIKERYIIPWLGSYLSGRIERRFGWRLSYRGISGNLFTELHLHGVRLEPIHRDGDQPATPLPGLAILAEQVDAVYTPLDLLLYNRVHRIDAAHCRALVGHTVLAFSISGTGPLTTISCPAQRLALGDLMPLVAAPERCIIEGDMQVEGEMLLKDYRPHLTQLRLQGDGVRLAWGNAFHATADARLTLTGAVSAPTLEGSIAVTDGAWSGVGTLPLGSALGSGEPILLTWANRYPGAIRLQVRGDRFRVRTDQLHARLRALLALTKEPGAPARLTGTLQALDGSYSIRSRSRRFEIVTGYVTFPDEAGAAPRLDALLETRVKRYRIRAAVQGTLRDSLLRLSAEPELSREEIVALLLFGKRLDALTGEEEQRLAAHDLASHALDLLFLGRVEEIAARRLGVDEIDVRFATEATAGTPSTPIESVEVGKYLLNDRIFGSYQVAPAKTPAEAIKHTVGVEYAVTNNVTIGAEHTQSNDPITPRNEKAFFRFRWKF